VAVRLRKPAQVSGENGTEPETSPTITLKPLSVSGVCVTRAALIEALRVYIPNLLDLEVIEDGERFLLSLAPPDPGAAGAA
jgi:hypothetical protein